MEDVSNLLISEGQRCIILVNGANNPTGIWHGEVTSVGSAHAGRIEARARICGGFHLSDLPGAKHALIETDECQGKTPHLNYEVYPYTKGMRILIRYLLIARLERDKARRETAGWKRTHTQTVAHLAERGLLDEDEKKPARD